MSDYQADFESALSDNLAQFNLTYDFPEKSSQVPPGKVSTVLEPLVGNDNGYTDSVLWVYNFYVYANDRFACQQARDRLLEALKVVTLGLSYPVNRVPIQQQGPLKSPQSSLWYSLIQQQFALLSN